MAVRRDHGQWRFRKVVRLPDGSKKRISGTPTVNTKWAAERAERDAIERESNAAPHPDVPKESPTFATWWTRYMTEWSAAQENKPGTVAEKESIFEHHLGGFFGDRRLDGIDVGVIQAFKAELTQKVNRNRKPLSLKTRNNILAVLSNALKYAEEVGLVDEAPRIRTYKFERPEIDVWEFDEWARLLESARRAGSALFVSTLLAGDAGLRLGEVLALQWGDIDLVAGRLTVARQLRKGIEGTPKGGRRRSVPMTATVIAVLKQLAQIRTGRVVCGPDGKPVSETLLKHGIYRVCRGAGLPEASWHRARHTFATDAARFGVNPWRLQGWLGHSSINMTMRYVHHVQEHQRPVPPAILAAGTAIADPDDRVIAMLGARSSIRGNAVAMGAAPNSEAQTIHTPRK